MKVAKILGVPFSTRGFNETVADLVSRIEKGMRTHVVTANPEIVMLARQNPAFLSILNQAYVVPDGIGVVYAAKWMNLPIYERVTGIELLEAMMQAANQRNWKVYLLGAAPEVNRLTADKLAVRYPGAHIVGHRDGFFRPEEEREIVEEIAGLQPDLLFVALGAPKADHWISGHWEKLQVPLAMGVGGSFDVIAGKVKRAPKLWQRMHLEWLYRLLSQPSRWKRQLAIPRFVFTVLREKWRNRT
jgi:N-acetylglucosaminyldiphosphoundecaprenol N-acetyl-beta-D-mannosaminyltransferase